MFAIGLIFFLCINASAQYLRGENFFLRDDSTLNGDEVVECTYLQSDVSFQDGTLQEFDACLVNDEIYALPVGLLRNFTELQSGTTRLIITGAELQPSFNLQQANEIVPTRRVPEVKAINSQALARNSLLPQYLSGASGNRTVIAVRITSNDSNVTLSQNELSVTMFGAGVTLASQFHACSAGSLTILPGVAGGVVELVVDVNTRGVASKNLEPLLRREFARQVGPESNYDHILFCLPEGTSISGNDWIAYAYQHTRYSYFNDLWCGSLTSKMHEMSHNFGLGHSGDFSKPEESKYQDRSCVMGVSYRKQDGPQECFNGARSWNLGWFRLHHVTVQQFPWEGKLVAFVDYEYIRTGYYVIINVFDLYIEYNLADKHNKQVVERGDMVTIVKAGKSPEQTTDIQTGLNMQNSTFVYNFQGTLIEIELCEPGTYGKTSKVARYYRMSIHQVGERSMCLPQPSSSPSTSMAPSLSTAPSVSPSSVPSSEPSDKPNDGGGCLSLRPGSSGECP